jgi:homoserine acetyltransferase
MKTPLIRSIAASGRLLKGVRVGWKSYGTLNPARDNVILIAPHLFAGSHAAGRYRVGEATPGYWDDLIGAGPRPALQPRASLRRRTPVRHHPPRRGTVR